MDIPTSLSSVAPPTTIFLQAGMDHEHDIDINNSIKEQPTSISHKTRIHIPNYNKTIGIVAAVEGGPPAAVATPSPPGSLSSSEDLLSEQHHHHLAQHSNHTLSVDLTSRSQPERRSRTTRTADQNLSEDMPDQPCQHERAQDLQDMNLNRSQHIHITLPMLPQHMNGQSPGPELEAAGGEPPLSINRISIDHRDGSHHPDASSTKSISEHFANNNGHSNATVKQLGIIANDHLHLHHANHDINHKNLTVSSNHGYASPSSTDTTQPVMPTSATLNDSNHSHHNSHFITADNSINSGTCNTQTLSPSSSSPSSTCKNNTHNNLNNETSFATSAVSTPMSSTANSTLPTATRESTSICADSSVLSSTNNSTHLETTQNLSLLNNDNNNGLPMLPKQQVFPMIRPTRESVLRRLSKVLMRKSLTMIDMSQRELRPSDARLVKLALLQNSNLSVLKLGYNNLGDEGLATLASGIASHGSLSSLDLGFNNISDEGCMSLVSAILSTFKCDNTSNISGSFTGRGTSNGAMTSVGLHTLYLAGNCIGEEGATALSSVIRNRCGLKILHLTGNGVGPDGVRCLMEAITDDEIRGGKLCEASEVAVDNIHDVDNANTLGVMTHLEEEVGLLHDDTGSNFVNGEVQSIPKSVPQSFSHTVYRGGVQELYLGGTGMGHIGCCAVARMLEHTGSLRVLSLEYCHLGDEEGIILAEAIAKNRHRLALEALQLSFNELTCKGIEPLMNAVWGSTSLKELGLDNNSIGDRGANVVSAVLSSVKTLKKLDLGFNSISAMGMRTIMKAVAENINLCSLSISGNNIDTGSAKAVAYALAYNKSLKSLFLDHCSIGNEGQRHITAGIVSNSLTCLHTLTGFRIGGNAVSLGLPSALQDWTNDQVLKFILLMWERMKQEQEEHSIDKELDPLHLLPSVQEGGPSTSKPYSGPLDPATVVAVAKRAYESLGGDGEEFISQRLGRTKEPSFESPLAEDAIMLEANGNENHVNGGDTPDQSLSPDLTGTDEKDIVNSIPRIFPIPDNLITLQKPPTLIPRMDLGTRKKLIVEWLCHNIHHLNELSQLAFNSSELWRLHQHFFATSIHDSGGTRCNDTPIPESSIDINSCASSNRQGSSILSEPFGAPSSTLLTEPQMPASEPVINPNCVTLPILKRKVSYRHLHEARLSATTAQLNTKSSKSDILKDGSVSKLIEDMNGHSMQPKSKRARRNRSRISFLPRIKAKLDSFLDSCHQKALVLMRQLLYIEKSLLNGCIYSLEGFGVTTYLGGTLAADAEMVLLDMM